MMNSYDIDGVIYMGKDLLGLKPDERDIIITGRSFQERPETIKMLRERNILNAVYFNPLKFEEKTRETSGLHKANILNTLYSEGYKIGIHFEDDPIQAKIISDNVPRVKVVLLEHDLVEKENVRHVEY